MTTKKSQTSGTCQFLQFQLDILREYMEDAHQPVVNHYGRKGWESKYDPKFSKGTSLKDTRRVMPDASSLPDKRWVKPREPEGSVAERAEHWADLDAWIKEHRTKNHKCQVAINGVPTWVYIFKKTKDAMLFKLTWG